MARAATTSDVFNAIAERRRRTIIDRLAADGDLDVSDLVRSLRMPQPTVSKHLGVLRRVRIVSVTRRGRRRVYRLNPNALKHVHDWVKTYERFFTHQLSRIKALAEQKAAQLKTDQPRPPKET